MKLPDKLEEIIAARWKKRITGSWKKRNPRLLQEEKLTANGNGGSPAAGDEAIIMAESSHHSSVSMSVPVFNGDNYDLWSFKMKTFFQSQDLWKIVQDRCGSSKEEKKKGFKVLFFLQQALTDEMFMRIMGATSAKEACDILKEEFHGSEKHEGVEHQLTIGYAPEQNGVSERESNSDEDGNNNVKREGSSKYILA
ncbi:hypothetical protein EZV62_004785 [Acer yangbiense]|uniref:DUF4219 domain-containing protein n=1 Tax=Acer yangbiense TaxID=1000413 RepID=A0A5C7IL24_9ROSI|nr:hypothetical protein EZV62_004785 [Acer yangbiense]